MIPGTQQKPEGVEEFDCPSQLAHGAHVWDHPTQSTYWCWGVKAHADTMIGRK